MKNKKTQKGQTLIVLLVFMVVAITITTAAAFIVATNSRAVGTFESGLVVSQAAEAGAERGLISLIRNPFYTGETLNVDDIGVTVNVVGTDPYVVTSEAVWEGFVKRVEVQAVYSEEGILGVIDWKELN
jgi:protein-S-isoprenylcysteine O-methyltransferase Ste14